MSEDVNGPDWKKKLLEIYKGEAQRRVNIRKNSVEVTTDEERPPVEFPDLTREEEKSLLSLKEFGLIEINDPFIELTEKGFNVADRIERERKRLNIKIVLIMVTLILALNGMFQFLSTLNLFSPSNLAISYIIVVILWAISFCLLQSE